MCVLLSIPGAAARGGLSDLTHNTRSSTMKYVLMYTNRPDLDAAGPELRSGEQRSTRLSMDGSTSMAM
jgi:hypothetical protein